MRWLYSGEAAKRAAQEKAEAQAAQEAAMRAIETESKQTVQAEVSAISQINFGAYGQRAVSFLARNFYNLKYVALVLAFCINFMLLFYKVKLNYSSFSKMYISSIRRYRLWAKLKVADLKNSYLISSAVKAVRAMVADLEAEAQKKKTIRRNWLWSTRISII